MRKLIGITAALGVLMTLGVANAATDCGASSQGLAPAECRDAATRTVPTPGNQPDGPGSTAYSWNSQNGPYYTIFDITIPEVLPNIAAFPAGGNFVGAGEWINGVVYMLDVANNLYVVDPATGTIMNTLPTTVPAGGETWSGMALDPTDGTVYASSTSVTTSSLFTMDVTTGTATLVGAITNSPGHIALAVDGAGDMWGYDIVNDSFMSIDKTTGAGTIVGPLGFDANFGQGMGWDSATDTLYMVAFNGGAFQAELRIVDRTTGSSTVAGVLGATTPGGLNQLSWVGFENLLFPPTAVCNVNIALPIPDNDPTGITDTITVPAPPLGDFITDLDVIVQATHTWVGDVTFSLQHVDTGTSVTFFDRPGVPTTTFGCSSNNVDANINDEGVDGDVETTCVNAPPAPAIGGDLVGGDPANTSLFAAFDGEAIAGDWTLTASDAAAGDTGTVDSWCINAMTDTMPFIDGFESGDTSAWTFVVP